MRAESVTGKQISVDGNRIKSGITEKDFRIDVRMSIEEFVVVFCDKSFNTGRIEDSHIGFSRVDGLTDGYGKIYQIIQNQLKIVRCRKNFVDK